MHLDSVLTNPKIYFVFLPILSLCITFSSSHPLIVNTVIFKCLTPDSLIGAKMKLWESFFDRSAESIASELLGMRLYRRLDDEIAGGIISETEAYKGIYKKDAQEILKSPGKIYVMPFMANMLLNVSTKDEVPSCVYIRELVTREGLYGPGKMTKMLKIDKSLDGKSINGDTLWIEPVGDYRAFSPSEVDLPASCMGRYRLRVF